MFYTTDQLLQRVADYEKSVFNTLIKEGKKKEKKKLDPKAKIRNRGIVCIPAEQALDHKDHFPINDEGQARNALSRSHQYSSAPSWYKGSLKGLQDLVSRKVHSKYPGIGKAEKKSKKSSVEVSDALLNKYGQAAIPTVNVEDLPKAPAPTKSHYPPIDKAFQTMLGVASDGFLGPITQKALDAYKAKVNPNNPTMNNELAFEFLKREPQYQTKQLLPTTSNIDPVTTGTNLINQMTQLATSISQYLAATQTGGYNLSNIKPVVDAYTNKINDLQNQMEKIWNLPDLKNQYEFQQKLINAYHNLTGQLHNLTQLSRMSITQPGNATASTKIDRLIEKYGTVDQMLSLLNKYQSTTDFLKDLAAAQWGLVGLDPAEEPDDNWKQTYEETKKIHDMIMQFADQIYPIESATW
jgi:hypothetical protein